MSEASAPATQIVINLAKGQDVRRLDSNEFIQREALERFAKIIKGRIRDAWQAMEKGGGEVLIDADGTPLFSDRRHATIVVRGKRGSGKTTFIRNVLALLDDGKLDHYLTEPAIGGKPEVGGRQLRESVVRLGVIDPTLIETKEHPFIIVVTKVKQAVDRHRKQYGDGGGAGRPSYQDWQKSLQELAKGIVLLDGVGNSHPLTGDGWEDPLYVMQQGLEKAGAGKGLEQELDQFLMASLRFLNKKAFILALDDIDTDFKRGWEILELLRRYLTSPCLITIMTGDLELYSMLVRGQQWDKFSKPMLDNEKDSKDVAQRRLMVSHLQDQYLFKVLPAHSQIGLLPVSRLSIRDQIQVVARADDERDAARISLSDFIHRLVVEGFGMGAGAVPIVKELLLSQPLRSLLQVMGEARVNTEKKFLIPPQELPAIFTYPLVRCGLTPEDLAGINSAGIFPILVRLFTDRQLWEGGHALYPNHEDEDVSLSLLVLNVVVRTAMVAEPALAIGYMIRIALAYEFLAARLSDRLSGPADKLQPFIDYAGLDRRVTVTFTASRIAVAIAAAENKAQQLGVIQVYNDSARGTAGLVQAMYGKEIGRNTKITVVDINGYMGNFFNKIKKSYVDSHSKNTSDELREYTIRGNYYNTIDSMVNNIQSDTAKWLASLPVCRGLRPNGEQPTYVTVHRLIAWIGRLLELGTGASVADIARLLREEGLIRSYAQPSWIRSDADQGKSRNTDVEDEEKTVGSATAAESISKVAETKIVDALRIWLSMSGGDALPPHIHSRIAARFFYTLAGIDDSIAARNFYLGQLLHRHIIAFLNAVLVEELLFLEGRGVAQPKDGSSGPASLRNPITTDQPFESNLVRGADCPYFRQIFSCPLWFMYLNNGAGLLDKAGYFDRKTLTYLEKEALSAMIAVKYQIPDLHAAIKSKTSSDEANVHATVTFGNLYDLYNSVGVQNVKAASNSAQATDEEPSASTEPGKASDRETSKTTKSPKPNQSSRKAKSSAASEVAAKETVSLPPAENEPVGGPDEAG